MSSIKIYPPNQLPAEGLTDVQFGIWKEELEVYLEVESKFRKFLPGGKYAKWTPAEENDLRILLPVDPDTDDSLPDIRRELRQFITIVAKFVHQDYYNPIIRQSSSLAWIYNKIRQDHNIETQGIHFFNLIDLKYDPTEQTTPIGFYNQYRSLVMGNLKKKHDVIQWKNETLKEDERLTASHEDLILLNVIQLIHPKLPQYIREQYAHKIGTTHSLMDYKTEILSRAKQYVQEIESRESEAAQISRIKIAEEPECNYVNTQPTRGAYSQRPPRGGWRQQSQRRNYNRPRNSYQKSQDPSPFCRVCHLAGLSRQIYASHYLGQPECPTISHKERELMVSRVTSQLGAVSIEEDENGEDLMREYGYSLEDHEDDHTTAQVNEILNPSPAPSKCNYIQPVPSQILTVQTNSPQIFTITFVRQNDLLYFFHQDQ